MATAAVFSMHNTASAQLMITPLQVVMEGRERSTEIILINTTDRTNTYNLVWEQNEQNPETGRYITDERDEGEIWLQDIAVFTPRRVTLEPREKQTVRIAVRRPADLPDGEYKSHLQFKVVPNPIPPSQDPSLGENEVSLGVQVNVSFVIPIVYRAGDYDLNVDLGTPSFEVNEKTGNLKIEVPVERSGIHGVMGEVHVYHTPLSGGQETMIGALGNANMFPEISRRTFSVPTQIQGLAPGTMRIDFLKAENDEKEILTSRAYPVGN